MHGFSRQPVKEAGNFRSQVVCSLLCNYYAQSAKDLRGTLLSKIKCFGIAWSYPPAPCSHPVPCAALYPDSESLGSERSTIFPEWFLRHFSSWLGEEKKRLPDNVTLVGAYVHFLKNVVLMPNPI